MARLIRLLLLAAVFAAVGFGSAAQAGPPSYLLLRQATEPTPGHPGHPNGVPQEVRAQGYAYGWFGVAPRTHAQRHFGYYRNYTQWSSW